MSDSLIGKQVLIIGDFCNGVIATIYDDRKRYASQYGVSVKLDKPSGFNLVTHATLFDGEYVVLDTSPDNDYWWWCDTNTYPSVTDASAGLANRIEGRYITLTWLSSGDMRLDLTPDGRLEAEYLTDTVGGRSDDNFLDLIEDLRANGHITLDPDDDGRNTIILGAWDFAPEKDEPRNDAAYWYDDQYVIRLLLDDLIKFYDDPREEATSRYGLDRKFPVVLRRGNVPLLYLADSEES